MREIHLCQDEQGKTGLRLKNVDQVRGRGTARSARAKLVPSPCQPCANPVPSLPPCRQGIFVQLVKANSPAALVGLRFGDQILQIDGKNCAGWSRGKAQRALKRANPEKIVMVVRDRSAGGRAGGRAVPAAGPALTLLAPQTFPAHRHRAQGQHRPPRRRGQEGQDRVAGQGQLGRPQRAPHPPLHLRGERPERHRHEGSGWAWAARAPEGGGPGSRQEVPRDGGQSRAPPAPTRALPQDKQLTEVLAGAGNVVTLTIIPTVIYEHMVKR